ncbi:hypothetical protein Ga0466249_003664 [Sporomusaceae bacterium BoRhaA]|nr:hypothetical protein [Pelorhabdus rhamnosifermentans]
MENQSYVHFFAFNCGKIVLGKKRYFKIIVSQSVTVRHRLLWGCFAGNCFILSNNVKKMKEDVFVSYKSQILLTVIAMVYNYQESERDMTSQLIEGYNEFRESLLELQNEGLVEVDIVKIPDEKREIVTKAKITNKGLLEAKSIVKQISERIRERENQ